MADLEVQINVNATKKSAETFAENIASGLQKSLGKLGMGSAVSVGKGGTLGPGVTEGVAAGLAAGGVVGLLQIIADAIKDLPIITAIMKILKLILMLLFLPLIPILKPVLMALAQLAKDLAPLMKSLTLSGNKGAEMAPQIKKTGNGFIDAFIGVANMALKVGGAIGQMIFDIGKGAFDLGGKIGQWLYDKVIAPVGNFISKKILEAFAWVKGIGDKIWGLFKGMFKGSINVVTEVWGWIKTFFKGTINVMSSVWDFIKSLFTSGNKKGKQLGGPIATEGIYYLHKGERVLSATERGGSGGSNISFVINNPSISKKQDINDLVSQIEDKLKSGMRRRVSYGPRNF